MIRRKLLGALAVVLLAVGTVGALAGLAAAVPGNTAALATVGVVVLVVLGLSVLGSTSPRLLSTAYWGR